MKSQLLKRGVSVGSMFFYAVVALAMTFCTASRAVQIDEVQAQEAPITIVDLPAIQIGIAQPLVALGGTEPAEDDPVEDKVVVDTSSNQDESPQISGQWAQLHLQDGSIIGGEIQTESIDVKTAYGVLTVPISRIVKIYPGLNSNTELNQRIATLLEDLGGPTASARDSAQKELVSMGPKIQKILKQLGDGGNAERKKRLGKINVSFDESIEEATDELAEIERPMIFADTIVTPDFSIVGEIQQQEFAVKSKFGALLIQLGDIKFANRKSDQGKEEIRKAIAVPAMAFFQKKPQSTGIRVNRGDKIAIRADGVVNWTNWNTSSSPEGLTNRSQWNGINSGKLTARIGSDNSKCVAIGNKSEFVAKSNGILYLGISMRDSYATNSGYSWTGEYKAKIIVNPKGN
jgi:hypothetical protein